MWQELTSIVAVIVIGSLVSVSVEHMRQNDVDAVGNPLHLEERFIDVSCQKCGRVIPSTITQTKKTCWACNDATRKINKPRQ